MARTPFKMRSGNSTPFKKMGSSPMKQDKKKTDDGRSGYEDNTNPMDLSKMTDDEIKAAINRNLHPKVVGGRTYELNTDTIMAGGEELARRFEARSKKKKK